jgi:predicted N-acetyltransferase YhbS
MKPRTLEDGLVLRNARPEDVPAIVTHVRTVHGEEVVGGIKAMYESHPRMTWEDTFVVADDDSGAIVSSLVLLPGTWMLDGAPVPIVQMEAVGTLKEYRFRGLVNVLNTEFERRVKELQPALQVIAGIPYFYRNFGYEYASPLGGAYPILPGFIPKPPPEEEEQTKFVKVDSKTIGEYLSFRADHLPQGVWVKDIRPEDLDYYSFESSQPGTEAWYIYLVKAEEKTVGVFILSRWERRLDVIDLYLDTHLLLPTVLRFAQAEADRWAGLPLRIVPPNQPAVREYVRLIAASELRHRYSWYVKIASLDRFFEAVSPVLSSRLEKSDYRDFTGDLKVTDYKRGFSLSFSEGKYAGMTSMSERDPGGYDLALSPGSLTRLLMGSETFDELESHEPDSRCRGSLLPIVRVLFPKVGATVDPFY